MHPDALNSTPYVLELLPGRRINSDQRLNVASGVIGYTYQLSVTYTYTSRQRRINHDPKRISSMAIRAAYTTNKETSIADHKRMSDRFNPRSHALHDPIKVKKSNRIPRWVLPHSHFPTLLEAWFCTSSFEAI